MMTIIFIVSAGYLFSLFFMACFFFGCRTGDDRYEKMIKLEKNSKKQEKNEDNKEDFV